MGESNMMRKDIGKLFIFCVSLTAILLTGLKFSLALAQEFSTVTGMVTENGAPIEKATIYIGENAPVITDSEGVYTSQAQQGPIRIFARSSAGVFIGEETITIGEGKTATVNFNFTPGLVAGTVTESGSAISGAMVSAGFNEPISSDSTGQYIAKIQPGEVRVSARTDTGEFIDEQTVIINAGETTTLNFDFVPGIVTGTVTENGLPLEGAKLCAGLNEPALTESSGRYTTKAKPGFISVFAYTNADEFIGELMVSLVAGGPVTVNFDFTPATITGVITEGDSTMAGAMVFVGSNLPITTDSTGKYTSGYNQEL